MSSSDIIPSHIKTPYPHSSAPVFHAGFFRHFHCISPNHSPRFHRSTRSTKDRTTATQPRKLKNFATPPTMLPNTHEKTVNASVRSEFQPRRAIFGTKRLVRSSFNDEIEWNYCCCCCESSVGVEAKQLPEDCEAEAAPVHLRGEITVVIYFLLLWR